MININDVFKGKIPTRRKFYYIIIYSDPSLNNLSLKRFKKDNFELKVFESAFLSMDRYDYLKVSVIKNIFKYLSVNLKYSTYSNVRNIVLYLNNIKKEIRNKMNSLEDNLENKDLIYSLKYINYNIDLLRVILSNRLDYDCEELEKIMEFEKITRQILRPDSYNEMHSLKIIFENLKLLNYHDHRNRNFSDLICNSIQYAKDHKNEVQLEYYKKIINYIINIKNLNINKRKIYDELNYNYTVDLIEKSVLDEKIHNLEYESLEGRYIIDDYIISIDNKETIKIDDALSIERTPNNTFILGIHITDVYSLGLFTSMFDNFQQSKEIVSKIKGSLREARRRKAISLLVEISENGVVIDYRILPTILRVDKNLLYSDVPRLIYNKNEEYHLQQTINNLISLYQVVENTKMPIYPSIDNIAHLLITKFMLLNGCIYSEYFTDNDIPGIYLSGDKNENKYTLENEKYETGFYEYDTYSKTTSPLYDKSSLICQYILHECAFKNISRQYKNILHYRLVPIVDELNRKSN